MALQQRQVLRTAQAPVVTPQLQQAIRLLQFSNLELSSFVDAEVQRNPLIERDDGHGDPTTGTAETRPPQTPSFWPGNRAPEPAPANTAQAEKSLREHLHEQLGLEIADPLQRLVGAHLIELIDETGYFLDDPADLAESLGCSEDHVHAALEQLRRFDPPGVFARNLAECLALQLAERNRLNPPMQILLANLDRLARGELATLRRRCRVNTADLNAMIAEIRTLDPKPGLSFGPIQNHPIIPEILVRDGPDGSWLVELNPDSLPRVLVNAGLVSRINDRALPRADRTYLRERFQSANWLVRSLDHRANTILRVAREIVRQQDGFFRHGVQYLKPLVRRDIAAVLGIHESTVSRATSNKYMLTPRGPLALKCFFTASIPSTSGDEALSAEAVRSRIRKLINDEPADRVLSDEQLARILKTQGIEVARRTVAKYRESMNIPSSADRRRRKRSGI